MLCPIFSRNRKSSSHGRSAAPELMIRYVKFTVYGTDTVICDDDDDEDIGCRKMNACRLPTSPRLNPVRMRRFNDKYLCWFETLHTDTDRQTQDLLYSRMQLTDILEIV
jgi:hypothetical protein